MRNKFYLIHNRSVNVRLPEESLLHRIACVENASETRLFDPIQAA
jgi:hypothetical protein